MQSLRERRPEAVSSGYDQDVWWTSVDGLTHLIDDLDERYRVNICRFLIDKAAARHAVMRLRQKKTDWLVYVAAGEEAFWRGSWGPVTDEPPTRDEMLREVRKEQDCGEHLDWMRSTPLFRRMTRGIEHLLGPGVLG